MLELSGLFACMGGLVNFFSAWGERKKKLVCGLLGGVNTQADTMIFGYVHIFK